MITIDESRALTFEFWQAANNENHWSTSWGAVNSLAGSGWGGVSTGSGASRLGGVIRLHEIANGEIPRMRWPCRPTTRVVCSVRRR